jgi:CRP-like cAMP-binding protein
MALLTGVPSFYTATALTPVEAYRLDKASIAAVMRVRPDLSKSLETQAKRGYAWIRCEAPAHSDDNAERPDMLLTRVRQFLHRLNV